MKFEDKVVNRLTKELADELFHYDPETGIVTRKIARSNVVKVGQKVGR